MNKLQLSVFTILLGALLFLSANNVSYAAYFDFLYNEESIEYYYENEDTGYSAIVVDFLDQLPNAEACVLGELLAETTEYCNVAVVPAHTDTQDLQEYCSECYELLFEESDGFILCADFYNNRMILLPTKELYDRLDASDITAILDDASEYMTWYDYTSCFELTLEQMLPLLENAYISQHSVNPTTGYYVEIHDQADLLTSEEERQLYEIMLPITDYGNVAFVTNDRYSGTAEEQARECYLELFGTESGTLFLIDMYTRYIWIHSDGEVYKTINTNYANSITDNVYSLATDKKYFECAQEAYNQILTLLEGGKIAQPMKYICNAILAFLIALSVNFAWMSCQAYRKRPKNKEILASISHSFEYGVPRFVHTHTTQEKNSSGGGGHRGGGSRGGGGGFRSGGGGGHRF